MIYCDKKKAVICCDILLSLKFLSIPWCPGFYGLLIEKDEVTDEVQIVKIYWQKW